ncbi:MAG TPA: rhomboid family intramembrane serine protease [Verrucomicrobiae bacterium]|jgi:membrane associated rhomboid family serine protease
MLEDRDYMRQPEYSDSRVSWTMMLLLVNAVVFLIQLAANYFPAGYHVQNTFFALSLAGLKQGYLWQLVTFQFMHAGWMHILFNSLAIYFFGRSVETVFGRNRFLGLYFMSGIFGGVVQVLYALVTHSDAPVVGASAGASGLIAAFAVINWREQFTLLFLYFIPVTLTGKILFWATVGLAVLGLLTPGSYVANAAHLGGIFAGFVYARKIQHGFGGVGDLFARRERFPEPAIKHVGANKFWRPAARDEDVSPDDFLQDKVDSILDKISAQGIQSLTAREREILESARKKMTRP